MKICGRKWLEIRRLGFSENFGRVWLLLEVNGMKIVVGLFIGWGNRVTFGQKHVTIWFCNGQNLKTTKIVSRLGKTCHDCSILKNFLARNRVTFWPTCHDLAMSNGTSLRLRKNLKCQIRVTISVS
jgi:hypothetical protein